MEGSAGNGLGPYRLLLATVGIAVFMSSLDVTIVNISLPTIAESYGITTSAVSWVVMAYLLMMCSFLPAFGRIGDIRGYRAVYTTGYAVFVIGSFLCGVSGGIGMLVGSRVLQGIGASMLSALSSAIVMIAIPEESRGKALGIVAMFASLGIALGPAIGGFLTTYLSWNWIFFINVPVGITGFFLATKTIPGIKTDLAGKRFDPYGAVLIFFSLLAILYILNKGGEFGWTSPAILALAGIAVICCVLFVWWEKKIPYRLFDINLFANRTFLFSNAAAVIVMLVFTGALFILPFYFEIVRGLPTDITGLVLTIPSAAIFIAGPIIGALSDRHGARKPCVLSAAMVFAGFWLFTRLGTGGDTVMLVVSLVLMGFGVGGCIPSSTVLIMCQGRREESGAVSSMMMTLRNTGSVMGVAIFDMLFMIYMLPRIPAGARTLAEIPMDVLVSGFSFTFMAGAVFSIIAIVLVFFTGDSACRPEP